MQRSATLTLISAATLMLALTACSGTQTRFYTLATFASDTVKPVSGAMPGTTSTMPRQTFIEVLPVSVPERLARPQIVLRSDGTRIDIFEQDRWSAPLNSELRDALSSRIANRLGAFDVTRGGRPTNQPVYRIAVEVRQFDAARGVQHIIAMDDNNAAAKDGKDAKNGNDMAAKDGDAASPGAGKVDASFGWTVTRSDTGSSTVCLLKVMEPVTGSDINGVVQGMQRAVANVGDAIAADVAALREGKSGVCST